MGMEPEHLRTMRMVCLSGDVVTVHEFRTYHRTPNGGFEPNSPELRTDDGKLVVTDSAGQFWIAATGEKLYRPNGGV